MSARRALEVAVKWAYRHDGDFEVPYRDNLSSPVSYYWFKEIVGAKLSE